MIEETSRLSQREALLQQQWLKIQHFVAHPFAESEAGREEHLPEYYVDNVYYDELLGRAARPQTTFLFAARGCGKSANRVMIESNCRPKRKDSDILAVSYTDFSRLLGRFAQDLSKVTVREHVAEVLRGGVKALFQCFQQWPELFHSLPSDVQAVYKWFGLNYGGRLLKPKNMIGCLREAGALPLTFDVPELTIAIVKYRLDESIRDILVMDSPLIQMLITLADTEPLGPDIGEMSSLDILNEFVKLARATGVEAVYVLIDQVDEFTELAADPKTAVSFLRPLVTNTPLLELPHLAWKLFLPGELKAYLEQEPAFRSDRLNCQEVVWTEGDLLQVLRNRLYVFSGKQYDSLAALCSPELERIDRILVRWAAGSPRNLLHLGEQLFDAYIRRHREKKGGWEEEELAITAEDLQLALKDFPVPPLRIDKAKGQVFIGEREIELSPLEYNILVYLYESDGVPRNKDDISAQVYPGGATDQAIDQRIYQMRQKIEPNPRRPIYLITDRALGYRLAHTG